MNKFKSVMLATLFTVLLAGCNQASAIGVIGGADGPTAIYSALTAAPRWYSMLVPGLILLVLAAVGTIAYIRYKNKK